MKRTHILFDGPAENQDERKYFYEGASPKFVNALKGYFTKYTSKVKSINLVLYLFNNLTLHNLFQELAEKGIKINIISIPLEGYDHSLPQKIIYPDGREAFPEKQTKYGLASGIYSSFENKESNYNLFIFPHTYIRSHRIKSFSRGKMPYSLHVKSLFIEFKTGKHVAGILSSNLAIRDLVKHDTMVLQPVADEEANACQLFFNHLIENSTHVIDYKELGQSINAQTILKDHPITQSTQFIAPFYKKSPEKAEGKIMELLATAKKRIWIMAQHLSAYNYQVPLNFKVRFKVNTKVTKPGILHKALEKGAEGVNLQCISQTYAETNAQHKKFREPVNKYNFHKFIDAYKKLPTASYFINDAVHSKYIIVDDVVIVSTFNYTPTQFIYLPYVEIKHFEHLKGVSYKGIFSEVGQMVVLTKKSHVSCFVKNFEFVKECKYTERMI